MSRYLKVQGGINEGIVYITIRWLKYRRIGVGDHADWSSTL